MSTTVLDERELERIIKGMEVLLVAFEAALPRLDEVLQHHQNSRLAEAIMILRKGGEMANELWKPRQ